MAKATGYVGNGVDTTFPVSIGFDTGSVAARLFDVNKGGNEVFAFQLQRQTPSADYVTLVLTPAPALNSIYYSVTDGKEPPDSAIPV